MKFKFTKNLDYQLDAIKSIVDIFDIGENLISNKYEDILRVEQVVSNELNINEKRILDNIRAIQEMNDINDISEDLGSMDFSIEMETGTGKTYVYLRTAMELSQKYGLKKFIILVPSVAIREGVLKTIEQTRDHFFDLYNFRFGSFAYDSDRLNKVKTDFVQSPDMQIMIMTIHAFNKDGNILRNGIDRSNGEPYIDLIAETNPVIIMDEPQNMESDLSKSAINDLSPLFKLRYSATHKERHNLMYSLDPIEAYKQGLVKKIAVYGVDDESANDFVFNVQNIEAKAGSLPKAKVTLEQKQETGYVHKTVTLGGGDELYKKSKKNEKYADLSVSDIDANKGYVELTNGERYEIKAEINENKEEIFRTQIKQTIKAHFDKQEEVGDQIKVLSLFFIDKVDNYVHEESLIRKIFEEEYEKQKKYSERFKGLDSKEVHQGYFAKKVTRKTGDVAYQDTSDKGRGNKEDRDAYNLIMKDKERLLSFDENVSFIFSHSALKEGWDNPNVFQICTLNGTKSGMKKRQEIGRGLRLPVDINGERQYNDKLNILTVIANENYLDFVSSLQNEYTEAGYKETPRASNAREVVEVKFKKHLETESEDFKNLWEKIRKKTKFNIEIDTIELIKNSIEKINDLTVDNLVIKVEKVTVDFGDDNKLKTIHEGTSYGERIKGEIRIENIIGRVVKEVGVTRKTVFEILSKSETLDLLFDNPEEYTRTVIMFIKSSLNELLINKGLKYYPVENVWTMDLFEDFKSYKSNTIESDRSAYDNVVFDSGGEREFAESLENSSRVTLFTKLPSRFIIDTPLGTYNPDWAIVVKDDESIEKLYLIRETKFVDSLHNLRPEEKQKILCGEKHFKAIGLDFDVSTKSDLSDLI